MRYFIEVALEENVTRAAEKLHVSQPALSRQVRDLEEELGFALLERSAKSVALTEAGRVFLDEASEVLKRLEVGIAAARAVAEGGSGELHIGYAPSLTVKILPPTIRAFQAEFPKVKVKLHDLSSEEMMAGLRSGDLDFAFMLESKVKALAGFRFEALKREGLRLAVGNEHALAKGGSVSLGRLKKETLLGFDLKEYPEYGDLLGRLFKAAKVRLKLAEQHESVSSLVAAVEAGMGVAVVTESLACVAGGRVTLLELEEEMECLVVGIAWRERALLAKEAAFLDKAMEVCRGDA
ncbi:LysR family transcriptional regulator [Pelagicoccus sp. SDUM812005]|uniref:LysR family transcriptional regulator n=1 Tax=Pelagicoccus sp. SDUM812005 TaxID=3041257 RepID=UPI0028102377|nr:LysR family transcriptional regulator [Pelagicoccus sp. SDUM812005]MDQ8183245.1 LysR family transcriptional regulator [Pelagicoccus sp. SDUM812005]